jgi:hypothetical protein
MTHATTIDSQYEVVRRAVFDVGVALRPAHDRHHPKDWSEEPKGCRLKRRDPVDERDRVVKRAAASKIRRCRRKPGNTTAAPYWWRLR